MLHDECIGLTGRCAMRHFGRFLSMLFLMSATLGFAQSTQAGDVSAADAKSVRAVIEAQLAAFTADDAPRAFSYAAPQLREAFGSADNFMTMVRNSYPVVYRHATVAFLKPEQADGVVTQGVHFTDGNGVLWLALYKLERQRDRSWRISGCQTTEAEGRAA
jgi:Domain of unknown function (DUF4864)